eukprot:CAMPEP_0169479950 /NCGR_PEP_ID=MMETSP1042-20121227/29299_1 /TAXON_ID=464988 /ORGANISM="Hemiselmis andersenii, Strain CCMP1180" /LENGTH=87 /DNA_ID=CAMNT_0009594553 /DNA_START=260 /DNA_END=520 /DNA_ORIENTATION=-
MASSPLEIGTEATSDCPPLSALRWVFALCMPPGAEKKRALDGGHRGGRTRVQLSPSRGRTAGIRGRDGARTAYFLERSCRKQERLGA